MLCAGATLWSDSVDRKIDDILAVQTEVAQEVVRTVRQQFLGGQNRAGGKRPTENLAALNLYLQGRYHLSQRTEQGLRKALEFFDKAILEDPQLAQAYSGLADAPWVAGSLWRRRAGECLDQSRFQCDPGSSIGR